MSADASARTESSSCGGRGKVFFRAINQGPWMLKRVMLAGEDITDAPYDLTGAANVEGLRVVLTDRLTDVSGIVKDGRAQPLKEFVVVVQPAADVPDRRAAAVPESGTTRPGREVRAAGDSAGGVHRHRGGDARAGRRMES